MKKKIIVIAAVLAAALTLTACSGDSSNSGSSVQSSSSSSSSSVTESSSVESSSSESSSSAESSSAESSSDESSSSEDTSSAPESETSESRAKKMTDAALAYTEEWTMGMSEGGKEELELLLPGLTEDMFEEYSFIYDPIGINGQFVFAGKPKAGQEAATKSAFESALSALKEQASFYPAGQESVENAANGETDDGYFYFVIHHMGKDIAAAMADAK